MDNIDDDDLSVALFGMYIYKYECTAAAATAAAQCAHQTIAKTDSLKLVFFTGMKIRCVCNAMHELQHHFSIEASSSTSSVRCHTVRSRTKQIYIVRKWHRNEKKRSDKIKLHFSHTLKLAVLLYVYRFEQAKKTILIFAIRLETPQLW